MAEYVRRPGGDVKTLYSDEGYEHKPFHPVRSLLSDEMSRVASGAQEGERQGVLSRFLHPEAGAESGQDLREAVLETLDSALLRGSTPDSPLLIVLEDTIGRASGWERMWQYG